MKHQLLFVLLLILCNQLVNAQEITLGAPQLYQAKQTSTHSSSQKNTLKGKKLLLKLPFWDDFSYAGPKPNASFWEDRDVYVNNGYAVNPVTIGVATFDALDSTGALHANANYQTSVIGDHLTSNPIDLGGASIKNVYLSFYYEPKGMGEMPDAQDSLVLEFYSPHLNKWIWQWSTPGNLDTVKFNHVILPVTDTTFLQTGFQFRFYNYFSLSSSVIPSLASNCDHWQLDYVYLNKDRSATDTVYRDIAFVKPLTSLLQNYESVPWKHFLASKGVATLKSIAFNLRNNDNQKRSIDKQENVIVELLSGKTNGVHDGGQLNINAFSNLTSNQAFDTTSLFSDNHKESAVFNITAEISTDKFDSTQNNKLSYQQKFSNYYAYDDGTAELGYGLIGEGASRAMCAYQFTPLMKDSLSAVDICFNHSFLDASKQYFYLTIWDDDGSGNPGKIIYKEQNYKPVYASKRDSFLTYYLKAHASSADTSIVLANTYYVGWIQTTADFLNVGFDLNRQVTTQRLFYNMGDGWSKSSKNGALMLRPVYRKKRVINSQPEIEGRHSSVFPNPANDQLTIKTEDNATYRLILFDTQGRQLLATSMQNGETQLDVSRFGTGLYLLKIIGSNKTTETVKVIISR